MGILLFIVGTILLTIIVVKAQDSLDRLNESLGIIVPDEFDYCGGNDNVIQSCKVYMIWDEKKNNLNIVYKKFMPLFEENIPLDNIIKIVGKTETQIRNDVTLTRLAVFGIFAFAMKKQTSTMHQFMVIDYINEAGNEQNLILGNVHQKTLTEWINRLREYKARKEAEELAQIEAELAELEKEETKNLSN